MLNVEVKGNLARLLATENLIIEHRNVDTAMFNIKDRVLTLPMWENASINVYDMLVGHEVGHALYTPDKWGDDYGVPQSYINVCEDARIEKLMKRKFPGLARNFYAGYRDLADEDFFDIGDRSIDSYALIDRVNLYFKIGLHAGEVFTWTEKEKIVVDMVGDAETFEETIEAVRHLLALEQEMKDNETQLDNVETTSEEGSGSSGMNDTESFEDGESEQNSNNDQPDKSSQNTSPITINTGGQESETDKAFSESKKKLLGNSYNTNKNIQYIELPDLSVDTLVISNKQIMKECNETFASQAQFLFTETDKAYLTFRNEAQREVNYLVKEFEMRKSADQYARSSTAKTGILDTQKLHTYKWNEDVFKKINVVPDGKNHGLIFILDWSGSMGSCLKDTAKQLLNLAWFCKKVQIPFDIYAFTNNFLWDSAYNVKDQTRDNPSKHHEAVAGQVCVNEWFSLMNLVSSSGRNGKDLEQQLKNFWRLVDGVTVSGYYLPAGYGLSGTPLNESVIALTALIPDFQKRTKVQKTNVVILTDGESQSINYHVEMSYKKGSLGTNNIDNDCMLRDRKTGHIYPRFEEGYYSSYSDKNTKIFLQCVRDRHPDVNLIGIRLINGRTLNKTYSTDECKISYEVIQKQWKKNKSAELVDFLGYQSLYLISLDALSGNSNFDTDIEYEDTKQISNAFTKSFVKKGVNKKMLTSFASLIS